MIYENIIIALGFALFSSYREWLTSDTELSITAITVISFNIKGFQIFVDLIVDE